MNTIPRKTIQNKITSPELMSQVNPENIRLMNDYIAYLKSTQKRPSTIRTYTGDLRIFFCWNLQHNKNKFFTELTKRDLISFQTWLIENNKNSPARVSGLKNVISSLSNYIENILDSDFENYKSIIRKIESPPRQAVRKKSIFEESELESLLNTLVEKKKYKQACMLSLAMCSGARKSELVRFKTDYFTDENIIYGSLYKTPEMMETKGKGLGKYIFRYVLSHDFTPYLNLWLKERERLGIESEWLIPVKENDEWVQMNISTLNSWALTFSRLLNKDFYWHSLRHWFTTHLARSGLPDSVIVEIIGWESSDMVKIYNDISTDEQLGKYFDADGIKVVKQTTLSDL